MATLKNLNVKDLLQSFRNRSNYVILLSEIRDFLVREKKEDEQVHVHKGERKGESFNAYSMKNIVYPGRIHALEIHQDKKNALNIRSGPFGKRIDADKNGGRTKKLIYSTNSYFRVVDSPSKNLSDNYPSRKKVDHDQLDSTLDVSIYEALAQGPVNTEMQQVKACMSYLNKIRLYLKKSNYELNLFTLRRHFNCTNEGSAMNFDEFMLTLKKVDIHLDSFMFSLLLDKFDLMINNCMVDYNEALKLLYWKCEMPPLAKKKKKES